MATACRGRAWLTGFQAWTLLRETSMLHRDLRRCPARRILVRLNPLVDVHDDEVAVAPNHVSIHVARGAPLGVDTVRLVLRIVLGTREPAILGNPFDLVILVRTRQRED